MSVIVLRHAQSAGQLNVQAYKHPGDDLMPITEWGAQQARLVGEFLGNLAETCNWDSFSLHTSSCQRGQQTSTEIANVLGINKVHIDCRLDKQRFGLFNGLLSDDEKRESLPEAFRNYQQLLTMRGPYHTRPPGGESIADVEARSADFLNNLGPGRHVVVTHGLNELCFEKIHCGHSPEWVLERADTVPNCRATLLEQGRPISRILYAGGVKSSLSYDRQPA